MAMISLQVREGAISSNPSWRAWCRVSARCCVDDLLF